MGRSVGEGRGLSRSRSIRTNPQPGRGSEGKEKGGMRKVKLRPPS